MSSIQHVSNESFATDVLHASALVLVDVDAD